MNSNFTSRITSARNAITGFLLLLALVLQSTNANSQCSTPTYCTPTVGSLNTYYIGIQNVTMGSINNSTTATGNGPAYSDYTNQAVFSSAGSTVSFSIQNGSGNSTMGIIYIDYNQDGTFGTSTPERVWVSSNTTASATVSGSFVVPSGQALGNYRIRVSGDFGGSPSYNPCANNYGEFEDYTLILGSSTPNISVVSLLPTTFGVGNNTVIATAKNLSTTTITSLSFGYNCTNGQAPTPTNLTGLNIAAGGTYVHTFSTALSLTAGSYTLKVWANNPNGVNPDANPCGDTMTVNACTGLSGSYTINPSGSGSSNFTTFNAAITKLATCGVAGPVTLTVSSGTYNEQVTIPFIAGASATNTITIDGVDTATRTISYNTNGGSTSAVIELNGARYVTVKNLTVSNLYASSPYTTFYAVHLKNQAHNNKILGCKLTTVTTSPPYYYAVPLGICGNNYYDAGDNGNNNLVDGNRLLGGYISMALIGSSSLPMSQGNTITNNKLEGGWQYGMYINYQGNFTVEHNLVSMNPSMSSSYGIYAYYLASTKIDRNTVLAGYYGISYYTYNYYAGSSNNSVSNNIIRNIGSSGYFAGLYMNNGINTTVAHNTVVANQASGNAIISYMSDVNNRINNNIFVSTNAGTYAMYISNVSTSYYSSIDWNTLIIPAGGTRLAYMGGSTLSDIPTLKAFNPSFNQNNNAKVPVFVSATDLHLSSAVDHARGKTGLNINIDIDGQARCTFAPSIGADESEYNAGPAVAGFTEPDSVFINSPVTFFNNNPANAPLGHKWYLDGVLQTSNLNYYKMFTSTGSFQVKLVTSSCSGSDSVTKTIVVYNPTLVPITDFIADLNVVETYQSVQLTDLSIKGPTYWNWTFIPSAGVNYNNSTTNNSQNPTVSFTNPGLYQVCLWDSNSIGRSVQVCKTAYILVKATNQMCIFPFDTKVASGTLYDDGGPTGNYSTGGTCNFLIDPCASSVNLKFTNFNLSTNSYLRIYNGTSNLAPPLHTSLGFTGTALPGGAAGITATSGKMYIEFVKGTAAPGFAASWTSVAASSAAPTGTLAGPDTVYDCGAYFTKTYVPSSLSYDRDGSYYKWYFDYANSNSFPDVEGKGIYFQDWSYGTTGSYIIRLDIEGCGGIETIYDTIYVDHPTTGPIVDFKADLLTATPNDVVNFTDLSTIDPIWWKWTISGPGSVNSVSGNSGSKNYGVKFTTPGVYTVRLEDSNCVASSSLTKTSYITIIEYCLPAVSTLNADFAIERFILGRTDTIINNTVYGLDYTNSSPAVGTVTYRDNTNKFTTYVVNNITIANKAVEAVVGLGESFNFNVRRLSNFNACNFNIWIDWNQDGTFQTSELVASSGVTTGANYTGSITIPSTAKLGYTRLRIGTNFATLANTPCGINAFGDYNDYRIKVTPDITAPVITITGNVDTVNVEVGRVFVDPGTTVTGATTVTHTGFAYGDTVTTYPFLGTHTITASDAAANTAIKNIYVRATPDVTIPVITRTGADTVYSEVGAAYTDLGATATDYYFGSVTGSIISTSTVNINKIGTYTVTYTVQDAAGNSAAPVVRVVIVRDTQIPVITISGSNPIYVNVFSTFNPPVATVTDNYNSGLSYVISGGPVNTTVLGTYTLFYNAKDSSGNIAATKSLTVIVQDVTAPQLTLVPQDTMIIDCITLTTVPEPGYIINDNYYPSNQITVSKIGTVNLNVLGTYVVRYYAADPSGNVDSSKVRVYKVIDRGAPVITLKGLDIMNWPRWKTFVDPGTTIFDKCDPTVTVTADYSKLDIYLDGLYEINYSATDASGNKAANVKRYVNIYTAPSGINANTNNSMISVYPNPNNGIVNVDLNNTEATYANIVIFDANGKMVYSNNINNMTQNKVQIDLSNEASGMYFIKVITDNGTSSKSFSIQLILKTKPNFINHMNTFTTLKLKTYRGKFAGVLLLFVLMVSAVNSFSQCSTPTYCNGNVTNVANYGIGMSNVTIGSSINNSTVATGAGPNYFDYTNLSVFASAGSTVSLSVTNGPSNSTGVLMYIDYNQDGTFGTSAPELVWQSSTYTASATVSGSFVIPSGQALGSYRIRVTGDYSGAISYNPCQLNYGEVEDYTLIIGNSTPNVSAVSSLPTTFAVGNNTVICTAKNLSTTTVTSMNFGYTCTNGQTVTPSTLTGLSIASGGSYTYTFATALSLTAGSYTLKIWANNPNGTNPDANVCGDTITITACTGMSGSFTIDPTGSGSNNFTSFGAAATKLANCGVAGPVTITVAAGTYNEQMILPNISGASATNTIVFDGVDTSTRTITYATGGNTAVIELNGAKYVTIKNLNIVNTLASSPFSTFYGIHMRNSANYNKVLGCKISVANTSPPYYYAVPLGICGNNYYDYGDNGNNNLIDGNRLIGGYMSMALMGNSNLPMCVGNTISNNKMEDAYQYGMYINYQGNFTIDHNILTMNNNMTSSYGIYAYYLATTNITRNIINASYYGIMFYTYSYYAPSGNCNITNNMLRNISTSSYYTGLYLNNGINTTVAHNTVVTSASSGNALLSYMSYSGNKINNNILVATSGTTYGMYIANVSTGYFTSLDYNTIIVPTGSPNLAYWGGSMVATIAALKALNSSFNQNNNDVQPVFQSTTNLHLSTAVDQARGIAGLGINVDIDGDARCIFAPSIGADESGYITAPPTAGYTVGTVYVNSPTTFLNNYSALLPMSHKWYVDGVFAASTVNFTKTFTTTGNYTICLKSTNCSGSDSTCTTVTVTTPSTPPFSDFIADKSVVNTFQNVNFTDLSSNGPSTWLWSVNPGTAGVDYVFTGGTTAASQNPIIYFTNSGNYNVCMKASNVAGGGNNRCKSNYIVVQAASSMCIFPFNTNVAVGNLYSSGGPNGGYGNNENCTYVIDACADSTFLKVTSASFGTGTVDRFEIYEGDYFPGKTRIAAFVASATYTLPVTIGVKGKMTVREVTDATSNNGTGIKANWFITNGTFAPPSGTIVGSSNAYYCASGIYNYYSSSFRDPSYTYDWDFDNDGIVDMSGMDGYYAFGTTGPDTIKLKISGCGGNLNLSKFVDIIAPPVPSPSFTSNLFTATSVDTVQLIDNSTGGVISWKWVITGPGAVNYVGGTSNTSRSPKVMAAIAGNYDVKLIVTNCTGSDSTSVSSQFKILGYCIPTAGNLLPDLTISRFQMGSIDNTITTPLPGTVAYRNFSQIASTNTDRGATYTFTVTRTSNYNAAGIKIWVDWNQDGTFSASEMAASTVTGNMTWTSTLFTPKTATLGATRLRIGVSYNNLSNTPCGANIYGEFQDFRVVVRPDVTAPVLTLGGSNPTYVEIGRNFVENGDVAIDAVDGIVTDSITYSGYITGFGYQMPISKQTTAIGTFTVTADAEDLSDNHSSLTRTVIVTPDTTKPVITLNGTNPMFVEVYNTFVDPGAVATDFYFTTAITVNSTNNVDVAHLGTYSVTYTATDINGNVAVPVTRTVIVRDTQKPVINFPANTDTVYVEVRNNYSDAGATVTDNYDLNLVASWTGSVNTYVPGTYYYTFTVTDASGNSAIPRVRVIIVRDHTAPELVLAAPAAPDTLVLDAKAYTVVPEPGYVATDNYYPVSQITISKSGSVDLNKIGIYTVTYTATDPAGNSSAPQRRIYKLVDRTKPVITIKGSNSINVCRWRAYNDSGATVTDNYYSGLQIVTSSNLDINLPGIYTITYTAVDSSGNVANSVTRYINVMAETIGNCQAFTGINNNNLNSAISVSPNPTNGKISIEIAFATEKLSEVIIYNSLGQVVRVVDNAMISNAKYNVDLQNEAAGIYFVTVKSENNTITKKFVLNK